MKNQVIHTVWCNISGETAGEICNWSLCFSVSLEWCVALLCTPVTKSSDRMATWNVPMRVSTFHPNKYVLRPRFFWSAPSRFVHARGHGHWSGDRAPCYPAVSLGNRPGAYRPAAWVCAYAVRGLGSNGGANFTSSETQGQIVGQAGNPWVSEDGIFHVHTNVHVALANIISSLWMDMAGIRLVIPSLG